jgi:hypothetical protein
VTPQKQRYRFAQHAGMFGDCHRTCIAMVLDMHRDDVPHFMAEVPPDLPADHPTSVAALDAEVRWLERRGLAPVSIPFPGDNTLEELLQVMSKLAHGAPVLLGCTSSNGSNHSVVIHDGVVHNPNDGSIAGPMRDGFWWVTVYGVKAGWRSPLLRDRVRKLFRALAMGRAAR